MTPPSPSLFHLPCDCSHSKPAHSSEEEETLVPTWAGGGGKSQEPGFVIECPFPLPFSSPFCFTNRQTASARRRRGGGKPSPSLEISTRIQQLFYFFPILLPISAFHSKITSLAVRTFNFELHLGEKNIICRTTVQCVHVEEAKKGKRK